MATHADQPGAPTTPPISEVFSFDTDEIDSQLFAGDHLPPLSRITETFDAFSEELLDFNHELALLNLDEIALASRSANSAEASKHYERLKQFRERASAFSVGLAARIRAYRPEYAVIELADRCYVANGTMYRLTPYLEKVRDENTGEDLEVPAVDVAVYADMISQDQFNKGFRVAKPEDWEILIVDGLILAEGQLPK